jgi:hypothetical protein
LVNPFFKLAFSQMRTTMTSASDLQRFAVYQSAFNEMVERFNLLSLIGRLQTFPVGISSLLAQTMPVQNPLGSPDVVQITSLPGFLGLAFLFTVVGWGMGGLYFRSVSGIALGDANRVTMISLSWAILSLGGRFDRHPDTDDGGPHLSDAAQPAAGKWDLVDRPVLLFLADRAVVLHPTWDLCAQAECFLFDLHQPEDGAFHTAHKRIVRALCVPAHDRVKLPVERSHR